MKLKKSIIYVTLILLQILTLFLAIENRVIPVLITLSLLLTISLGFIAFKEMKNIIKFNKQKNNFLSKISHEIRTPLNGIVGMNNLILLSELTNEQRSYAKTILSCSESLLTTINDMTDYSLVGHKDLTIENIQFDIRKFARDFYEKNQFSVNIKNIIFKYHIDPEASNYYIGDPGRIRQVLSSFLNNSIKFTKKGTISLDCDVKQDRENTTSLRFSIKDSGSGIKKDQLELIKRNLAKKSKRTDSVSSNLGFGLAISKYLSSIMNGNIGVESAENIGSEFWIELTLEKGKSLLTPVEKRDLKQANILLITRGIIESNSFERILKMESIMCMTAETLEKGLLKFNNLINLVILGFEEFTQKEIKDFTEIIKKESNTKVMVITKLGKKGDGQLCRDLNIDAYFVAPIREETLFESIAVITSKKNKFNDIVTIHTIIENKRSKVNILVVDDNKVNLLVAQKLLLKMGFRSEIAENGEIALERLRNKRFSIVLMDIQMPVMNGLQATKLIRSGDTGRYNSNIPVIALTANYTQIDRDNCSNVGMNEFLTKPYRPEDIENVINRYIRWEEL